MQTVAVLALEGVVPADLATPCEVFGRTRLPDGRPGYRVHVCAMAAEVDAGSFRLRAPWGLDELRCADTIVLPGRASPTDPVPEIVLDALREAAARGTRIASICTGAFTLAATGLLDGLTVTTHWRAAELLARTFPAVRVDPNVLYLDHGQLLTSAGAAAGLDLCLHLVRRDHGAAVAADVARLSVMPLERAGGQAQFIVHPPPAPADGTLEPLLRWLDDNLHRDLDLEDIAAAGHISTRTLNRRFRSQLGDSPLQWLLRARVRRAQELLETTDHPIQRVARQAGFASTATFRERFRRLVGVSPGAYRESFRGPQRPATTQSSPSTRG